LFLLYNAIFIAENDFEMTQQRNFQIFVKPVSSACNLRCSYCYYINATKTPDDNDGMMSDVLLEKYIAAHIEANRVEEVVMFSWHGGEPMLAGINFYKKAVALQKNMLPPGKKLVNGIQTNGTLINEEWCQFFSKEHFLVGISIDGPEHLHNNFRIGKNGAGSFEKVINGYRMLQNYGITTEILCVVNAKNAFSPLVVYHFFKLLQAKYITFLPLVEQKYGSTTEVTARSVQAEAFGRFLIEIYDEWVENDVGKITIQIFEEALQTAFSNEHTLCVFKENCGGVPVVESNGNFYACDHFVNDRFLIGNINDEKITDLLDCDKLVAFGRLKSETLPGICKDCNVREMCNGECPKNRFCVTPSGEKGLNYLCEGYKMFFLHCLPLVKELRQQAILTGRMG